MAPAQLSAFEARRLANVATNEKLIKDAADLGQKIRKAAKPPPKPAAPRKRRAAEPAQKTRIMPTRQSARLSGTEPAPADPKVKVEEGLGWEPKPKRARTGGDLNLSNLAVEGTRWANLNGSGSDTFASFAQGAQPGVRTFTDDDAKDTSDEKLKDTRKAMSDLELYDGWLVNGKQTVYDIS